MSLLNGVRVIVAGAGLAGLVAARDLVDMGADVIVVEAQERVGGRVLTIRDRFADGQHAEAGGDLIEESQREVRQLAEQLGLELAQVLRGGFGYARPDPRGRTRILHQGGGRGWDRLAQHLAPLTRPYLLAERRWDTPIAAAIARQSVAEHLNETGADEELRDTATGLRGFFLADPDELSLVALVDQFSEADAPASGAIYRVAGGNDRLATALAARLGDRVRLNTELVAVAHRGRGVRASVRHRRQLSQIQADHLVVALPASLLRRIPLTPSLPAQQHEAIARLKYGRATKTLLQFTRRFWRAPGRPRGFGSPLPFGAVWEANEEQRGRAGILSFLGGGSASDAARQIVERGGARALAQSLEWLGARHAEVIAWHQVTWETDQWARGGYAYFDPAFDPTLRAWLARPCGALFFAGEHTSLRWQGYMNGAVESGRRAAAEITATRTSRVAMT